MNIFYYTLSCRLCKASLKLLAVANVQFKEVELKPLNEKKWEVVGTNTTIETDRVPAVPAFYEESMNTLHIGWRMKNVIEKYKPVKQCAL